MRGEERNLVLGSQEQNSFSVDTNDNFVGNLSAVVDTLARRIERSSIVGPLLGNGQVGCFGFVWSFSFVACVFVKYLTLPYIRLLLAHQVFRYIILQVLSSKKKKN